MNAVQLSHLAILEKSIKTSFSEMKKYFEHSKAVKARNLLFEDKNRVEYPPFARDRERFFNIKENTFISTLNMEEVLNKTGSQLDSISNFKLDIPDHIYDDLYDNIASFKVHPFLLKEVDNVKNPVFVGTDTVLDLIMLHSLGKASEVVVMSSPLNFKTPLAMPVPCLSNTNIVALRIKYGYVILNSWTNGKIC